MLSLFSYLRTLLFYLGYWLLLPVCSLAGLLIWPVTSFHVRTHVVTLWNRFSVWWLQVTCGVRYQIIGRENLPKHASVILSNHQSAWETLLLQYLFQPLSTVLKQELLNIPVFGWALRTMEPIAIDRSNPREALRAVKRDGIARLKAGNNVLVFPEGTRVAPGTMGNYARSGADIACDGGFDIIPVAHNAGTCWPAKQWVKVPGLITVVVGAPISTKDKNSKQVMEEVKIWTLAQIEAM